MKSILLFALGAPELIVIVVLVLLLFGGKKIPELMKGLGKGISEFKKGKKESEKDLED
jgi:sec-independent protein translocase protein TatA